MNKDKEHLKLLAIFHYVLAAMTALCSLIPTIYMVLGLGLAASSVGSPGRGEPAVAGILLAVIGGCIILFLLGSAALIAYSGKCLQDNNRRTFSLVVAGFLCLNMPFGTVLGVFTIVVLMRESVQELYEAEQSPELAA
jgi:hypothetical protein